MLNNEDLTSFLIALYLRGKTVAIGQFKHKCHISYLLDAVEQEIELMAKRYGRV